MKPINMPQKERYSTVWTPARKVWFYKNEDFKRVRTTKKMEEQWDKSINDIKHIDESNIKHIPRYVDEKIKEFDRVHKEMKERGQDIGTSSEPMFKRQWAEKKLKEAGYY